MHDKRHYNLDEHNSITVCYIWINMDMSMETPPKAFLCGDKTRTPEL